MFGLFVYVIQYAIFLNTGFPLSASPFSMDHCLVMVLNSCCPHMPILMTLTYQNKGVAERGSRTKGWRGGGPAEGWKKKVTSPILMAEVVVDVPKGTLDGSPRAAHRTVLRIRPYILRPYFYKFSCYPYRKVILKKLDGTVRVKKQVYGRIYGFLHRHK